MKKPWMPFYGDDYKGDTEHLNRAQHASYIFLIWHYWKHGNLPDDDKKLAAIAKATSKEWAKDKAVIREFFLPGWRHKRIDEELAKADLVHERRVEAGAAAANKRWGNSEPKTRSQRLSEARKAGTHTDLEWSVLQSVFGKCVKCGTPISELSGGSCCKDHVLSVYKGGTDSIYNIQPLCRSCNSSKSVNSTDYRDESFPNWRDAYEKIIKEQTGEAENIVRFVPKENA